MSQVRTVSAGTTKKGSDERSQASRAKTRGDDRRSNCAVEATLGVIGGRWKGVVLYWLLSGKHRFGELRRRVPNCTERMLTLQLRELEEDGLLTRTVFAEVPPRVEYELTAFGRSLEPILLGMREWGERYKRRL
ncbi:MAG: helix-turn-helix transcriptional regulator [Deltaproteobacteria bacterium]|nr:helix-turn-helix transcriptional regulator [Deltaproteobacteria bacterium]